MRGRRCWIYLCPNFNILSSENGYLLHLFEETIERVACFSDALQFMEGNMEAIQVMCSSSVHVEEQIENHTRSMDTRRAQKVF
ncbi:hypothetical protein L1987_58057 [Smallanthus sonchifolius]|uniref:Uncharacterized protein n=1 Tax=Smallanthus sonchifolius TaxID=185202 RepID=A0ACB9DEP9_9ASTR|nr:hypothetical protein L1987_58057 [Smallanthus sonchifolius]